jgi:hypothetical protein
MRLAVQNYPSRATKVFYKIEVVDCNNPWADSMRPYMQTTLEQKLSNY